MNKAEFNILLLLNSLKKIQAISIKILLQLQREEAVLGVNIFIFDIPRCSVGYCIENNFQPFYFYSKYPEKLDPTWNLLRLFPPLIWAWTFASISATVIFFAVSAGVYKKMNMGYLLGEAEIGLFPFR